MAYMLPTVHSGNVYALKRISVLQSALRCRLATSLCSTAFFQGFSPVRFHAQPPIQHSHHYRVQHLQIALQTASDTRNGFALCLHAVRGLVDAGHPLTGEDYGHLLRHAVLVLRSCPATYAIWDVAKRTKCCITSDMLHFRVLASLRDDDLKDAIDVLRSSQNENTCRMSDATVAMLVKKLLQGRHYAMLDGALDFLTSSTCSRYGPGDVDARRALLELCVEAYVHVRRPREALAVFASLEQQGIQPTIFGYNGALHAWSQISHRMRKLKRGALMEAVSSTESTDDLAAACANVAGIFAAMSASSVAPNEVSFNHYLQVLCHAKQLEEAARIPMQMIDSGFVPQVQTFTTLISALIDAGNFGAARRAFLAMKACSLPVNVPCSGALVKALSNISQPFETASDIVMFGLQELRSARLAPSDILHDSLIRGFIMRAHISTAADFVNSLPKPVGDSTWRCIYYALLDRGLMEAAWDILSVRGCQLSGDALVSCITRGMRACIQSCHTEVEEGACQAVIVPHGTVSWSGDERFVDPAPASSTDFALDFFASYRLAVLDSRTSSATLLPATIPQILSVFRRFLAAARLLGVARGMDESAYRMCKLHGLRPRPHREEAISAVGSPQFAEHLLRCKIATAHSKLL